MNYKRKSRRRFFLLMRPRTPPISSEFRGGGVWTPNPPSVPLVLDVLNLLWWNRKWTQCSICSTPSVRSAGGRYFLLQAVRSRGTWCSWVFWWTCHICRYLICPVFLGQSRFYGVWGALSRSPANFCSGNHMSRGFPSHKNAKFLTKCTNILAFPLCEKTYTGCPRRNGQNFGRVFLMLNYTDIAQNTYIQSWTVTEIMAREIWNFDSCYTLIDYQIHIKTGRNMWFL